MKRQTKALIQTECQQLLYRVSMLLDQCRWQELANCYTEDGVLYRPSDAKNAIVGREDILASFIARPPRITCHLLSNIVCDVHSDCEATVFSRVWLVAGEDGQTSPANAGPNMLIGSFEDSLVRIDDQWLIKCRKGGTELKYSYQSRES